MPKTLDELINSEYPNLSDRLRMAADFVIAHPTDVATRSLRTVAASSGLAPATYSRLARALDFPDYEALREECRKHLINRIDNFETRAEQLQDGIKDGANLLDAQTRSCSANITQLAVQTNQERLDWAVSKLANARQVTCLGSLSSQGIALYAAYVANYFSSVPWVVPGIGGREWATTISRLNADDVCLVITKPPFARTVLDAAEHAHQRGATVILITDEALCPAARYADATFVVAADSPQFFSSYAATLVLLETLIGMLAAQGGKLVRDRIAEVEATTRRLGLVQDPIKRQKASIREMTDV